MQTKKRYAEILQELYDGGFSFKDVSYIRAMAEAGKPLEDYFLKKMSLIQRQLAQSFWEETKKL